MRKAEHLKPNEHTGQDPDEVLTVEEIATELKCSERHVRALLMEDEIKGAFRVGNRLRTTRAHLDAYKNTPATKIKGNGGKPAKGSSDSTRSSGVPAKSELA